MKTQRPLDEYFIPEPNSGCWLWLGAVDQDSYGVGWDIELSRNTRAHRMVYEILVGPIHADKKLLHRCDNPICVNPDHMTIGTTADNNADMCAKKRHAFGTKHGRNKLSDVDVYNIRASAKSTRKMAAELGVSQSLINHIRVGRIWKHLED